jgi:hypothetical protein
MSSITADNWLKLVTEMMAVNCVENHVNEFNVWPKYSAVRKLQFQKHFARFITIMMQSVACS